MTPPLKLLALVLLLPAVASAGGIPGIEPESLVINVSAPESANSASEGYVTAEQLENRPRLRNGELLEAVPGLIVTQHSGDGKANQYFLRGFNLDHGTDFRTTVAGMPVNLPTHGHGQGYTDLGFLIPELVSGVHYRKGTHHAEEGDFATAGAARMDFVETLPVTLASLTLGENGFRRAVLGDSFAAGPGQLLLAGEALTQDGPWVIPEDVEKYNALASYSWNALGGQWNLLGMAYTNRWTATDQVALRAVNSGAVDRFGSLDPTTGGETSRYSLSGRYAWTDAQQGFSMSAYLVDYELNLFSNFTYFLDDPVNGDQFEQEDDRRYGGGEIAYERHGDWLGIHVHQQAGAQLRRDVIASVGLFNTAQRQRLNTVRQDQVRLTNLAAWYSATAQWQPWLRTTLGLRQDQQKATVGADLAANSGEETDDQFSPKFSVVVTPLPRTELFLNAGRGFHSNDARGSTILVDPSSGAPAERVSLLVPADGAEIGTRYSPLEGWQLTATLWQLELDSELVFVGDAGTTSANRPSERRGVELSSYYTPMPGVILDADVAVSRARFADVDPAGDRIPGSIERTASLGLVMNDWRGAFAGLRVRYFGGRPLIEDDTVRSGSSTLVNLRAGYRFLPQLSVAVEVFNLFDRQVSDIEYFYESQLPGEGAPVEDLHFHPAEPQTFRVVLDARF